jgi:HK97 family phage major capsid protein
MSKAQELRRQRAEILKSAQVIVAKAESEKRELTDEEATSVEKMQGDADALLTQSKAATRESVNSAVAGLDLPVGRKTLEPTSAANPMGAPAVATPAFLSDPKRGYRRAADFFRDVIRAERTGRVSVQLESLRPDPSMTAGSDEASENSDGYFLVPTAFSPNLLALEAEEDPTSALVTQLPMAVPSIDIPARVDKNHTSSVSGGFQVFRRASTQSVDPKKPAFEKVSLKAESLFGISIAEEELLADSPISYAALLDACARDEMNGKLLDEKINGDGVGGSYLGALNSPCLVTVDAVSGQDADTVRFENIVDMRSRCWRYGKAIWLANHDVLPSLMKLNQAVGVGGVPAWLPSGREDHPDILLGRPIFFTEFNPAVGDVGDVLLGVWSQFLHGTLEGMKSDMSTHVRFNNHERSFKFWLRDCGAPWWRTPLTPKRSAKTLSPFVALAAR